MLQYLLLGAFAGAALLSFVFRLRVSMLEGAISRGEKDAGESQVSRARFSRFAMLFAVAAAASLALCIAVGALQKFS